MNSDSRDGLGGESREDQQPGGQKSGPGPVGKPIQPPRESSAAPITIEDLRDCKLSHRAHLDGPRGKEGWFGDLHQCVQFPRLQRIVRYYRKDKSHAVEWQVDQQRVDSLEAAVEALNKPVMLTEGEQRALAKVTDEYLDLRQSDGIELTDLLGLSYKGMIEFENGKCRRRAQKS